MHSVLLEKACLFASAEQSVSMSRVTYSMTRFTYLNKCPCREVEENSRREENASISQKSTFRARLFRYCQAVRNRFVK